MSPKIKFFGAHSKSYNIFVSASFWSDLKDPSHCKKFLNHITSNNISTEEPAEWIGEVG